MTRGGRLPVRKRLLVGWRRLRRRRHRRLHHVDLSVGAAREQRGRGRYQNKPQDFPAHVHIIAQCPDANQPSGAPNRVTAPLRRPPPTSGGMAPIPA